MTQKATHKPIQAATKRTKNRFREHTLMAVQVVGSIRLGTIDGESCILFESVETNTAHRGSRWMGWIPASEVERIKE